MIYAPTTTALLLVNPYKLLDHLRAIVVATADFSPEAMHAAHAINGPTYAHVIATTDELIAALTGGAEARMFSA